MNNSTDAENRIYYKFSVVMAIYNSEDYLENSIDSVINQTIGFEENVQRFPLDDISFRVGGDDVDLGDPLFVGVGRLTASN